MELFYILLILLFVSRTFGAVAHGLGQPTLVGELIAGIAIGLALHATGFDLLEGGALVDNEVFTVLTDLGIFFLMLLAGLELRPDELREASVSAVAIAVVGMVLPLAAGFALGWWMLPESDLHFAQSLFLGTALAVTAVPVAARVLIDLGRLDTPVGRAIISAAVIDDVLSLILLAMLTGLLETGTFPGLLGLGELLGKVAAFFLLAWLAGRYVIPPMGRAIRRIGAEEVEISTLLVIGFGYAYLAEALGLHFIVGAFFAGLYFRRRTVGPENYAEVKKRITGLTTGFLAPLFFVSIGLHVAPGAVLEVPLFVIGLTALAFLAKLVGAGVPAAMAGYSRRDATAIGVGMSGRGAVELIIADIALRAGLFSMPEPPPPIIANLFSAVVIMAIITTIATPILLRPIFLKQEKPPESARGSRWNPATYVRRRPE
jgi:Kef-type K+ transport system membrane component KefB